VSDRVTVCLSVMSQRVSVFVTACLCVRMSASACTSAIVLYGGSRGGDGSGDHRAL
jgi:hypothetical protein